MQRQLCSLQQQEWHVKTVCVKPRHKLQERQACACDTEKGVKDKHVVLDTGR